MSERGRIRIGTSGWSYPRWRDGFYAGIPQRRWLSHCAEHFTAIEVNATFYRTIETPTLKRWLDETPDGLVFALKGHKVVSHVRKLREVGEYVAHMRAAVGVLGPRLAVVLWQLPPNLPKDAGLLREFAESLALWPEARHTIEFRHPSWFDDETAAILTRHALANCISDAGKWPMWEAVTADLAYVRLHGHERTYASEYGEEGLRSWAERVRRWAAEGREVHVYFDNDAEGAAPYDALRLIGMTDAGGGSP